MALEMRERCQRCAWPLGPDDDAAYICSYESTFCATCANALNGICPDCAQSQFPGHHAATRVSPPGK